MEINFINAQALFKSHSTTQIYKLFFSNYFHCNQYMASSHCLPSSLTLNQEKCTTSSTTISPHPKSFRMPDLNELSSLLSPSSDFIMTDNIIAVLKKILKSSKEHSQKDLSNCNDSNLNKVSKKKRNSEKLTKFNKIQKEPTNLKKRSNKEIYKKDDIYSSTPKKHVKGENGRIEKSENYNEKELSVEKSQEIEEKSHKSSTIKQINSIRTTRAKMKILLSEEPIGGNIVHQLEKMNSNSLFQDVSVHDNIKPLISNIISDKFSKHKQFDQLSDISLSKGQSSPSSNAKKSSKNQSQIINNEQNKKDTNLEILFNAPKILKKKTDLSLNPDPFYTLLKYPTNKLASSKPENKGQSQESKLLHSKESHSHIQGQANMFIEQINPLNNLDDMEKDNLFGSAQVIQKTSVGRSYQVGVPNFVLNTKSRKTSRGIPKQLWNPELMSDEKLNETFEKIEAIIERKIKNQERAIECLQKFNLNVDKLLENIKKNRFHYQNCFGLEQRVLRNRKNL